jgi:hypothetical protein
MKPWRKKMSDDALAKPEPLSVAALEAEERLAALDDRAARFAELLASGVPLDESAARAGLTEGEAQGLAVRGDVVAAIGAVRERNVGASTDRAYVRRVLHSAAFFALKREDTRALVQVTRALSDLDGLDKRPEPAPTTGITSVVINIGGGGTYALGVDSGGGPPPCIDVTPAEPLDATNAVEPPRDALQLRDAPPSRAPLSQNSDLEGWLRATEPPRRVKTAGGPRVDPLS